MPIEKPACYSRWKFHPLTTAQKREGEELRSRFMETLRNSEKHAAAAPDITLEFRRASLTLSPAERQAGVYHRYRDGRPFFRIKVAVRDETDASRKVIHGLIGNMRCDKTIRDRPFAIEFDTRAPLASDVASQMCEALLNPRF